MTKSESSVPFGFGILMIPLDFGLRILGLIAVPGTIPNSHFSIPRLHFTVHNILFHKTTFAISLL